MRQGEEEGSECPWLQLLFVLLKTLSFSTSSQVLRLLNTLLPLSSISISSLLPPVSLTPASGPQRPWRADGD